ncbi:NXPE family member 4-like [Bombina bombina]|uniref:NXPE family member 4-like n=1 Tax=Bombina bombina TaxID=8345 RepID=UPI00235AAD44|nr:NXPE family member 4-like [Bombina bombina]
MAADFSSSDLDKVSQIPKKVNEIYNKIDSKIPRINFTHKNQTTSPYMSRVTIRNPKERYCVGNQMTVQVDMFDYFGRRKTHGGDYLRARIFTPEFEAGTSGRIEDFDNGTYHINFTLFWEGNISVAVFLMHPSEAISALWNSRNTWHGLVDYSGKFISQKNETDTKCGFALNRSVELCEYIDHRDGEYFYCIKPTNFLCDSLTEIKSWFTGNSKLSPLEASLLVRSNVKVKILNDFQSLNVVSCSSESANNKTKCKIGMKLEFPGGYFMKNVWYPRECTMITYPTTEDLNQCMKEKFIYMFGDSTLKLWMKYFQKKLKNMTMLNLYGDGWAKPLLGIDLKRNMKILWKRHAQPFVSSSYHSCREDRTIPREIDLIGGNQHTIIALHIGIHFRSHPIHHYIRRLFNIRHALERLFHRSPQTKVIIKTENNGEIDVYESKGDFHGYIHYRILESVFKDLNVGFVNGWDMTIAFDSNNLHPPEEYYKNEVDMLMTYIC